MLTAYAVPEENTSPRFARAFAAGAGCGYSDSGELLPGDVAMFGSTKRWDILMEARAQGRDWFYGDHAYFGRLKHYRVTRNAFQASGDGDADLNLVKKHGIEIKPWQTRGGHILVCPPDHGFEQLMLRAGVLAAADWGSRTLDILRRYTDRKLVVRDLAEAGRSSFTEALDGAWALVTFMSNAAVEAAMAGIPVFALGPCAARAIGRTELSRIESPIYPERHQFAANLLAQQWTLDEMADGTCWRALQAGRAS